MQNNQISHKELVHSDYQIREVEAVVRRELWRSPEQQEIYFKSGRSKTMNSNHLRRCAIDLNFFWNGKLVWDKELIRIVGEYWESLSPKNRWGGNFKGFVDVPHFERISI